ncbi:MAG TPA: deoxyribodipyrimidine photo-lyase [Nocardioidaceae bacterium]|nr:deoxyribodipyrimidine photo-lyase [Nocardioidaceae bacterium]
MTTSLMWFRRDLRLHDNPALMRACADGEAVVPVFVLDPRLWGPAGPSRRAYLLASLRSLRDDIGGLVVRFGDPRDVLGTLVDETAASSVHIAADFGPYGSERDASVEKALASRGVDLVRTGSPYAVAPGRVTRSGSSSYQVFSPFARAWRQHGWRAPAGPLPEVRWSTSPSSDDWPTVQLPAGLTLPQAGEAAAWERWRTFLADHLAAYGTVRDRPDLDATSRMSVHLKWGEIHPRTLLADLEQAQADSSSVDRYRLELAWREFYADVLARRPDSAREYYRPQFADLAYDDPGERFDAWREGRTGYPIVDAGMRQLRAQGWMHNRVRMIVASFLVKDLHIEWQHGARHFMHWLVDADLASNSHGWQWTAGSGTDPAPYFRVFNPIEQGKKFDPDGVYIRRWLPELRDRPDSELHQPHNPIVEHAAERREALRRYEKVRQGSASA